MCKFALSNTYLGCTFFYLKFCCNNFQYDFKLLGFWGFGVLGFWGFAGSDAQKRIAESLVFGVENHGRGKVVYMIDNPLFRGFWEGGKLFFANALFMIN